MDDPILRISIHDLQLVGNYVLTYEYHQKLGADWSMILNLSPELKVKVANTFVKHRLRLENIQLEQIIR